MTVDLDLDIALILMLTIISSSVFSIYAFYLYDFKLPTSANIKNAKLGFVAKCLLRRVVIFKFTGPFLFVFGSFLITSAHIWKIDALDLIGTIALVFGLLQIWFCVSWDAFTK